MSFFYTTNQKHLFVYFFFNLAFRRTYKWYNYLFFEISHDGKEKNPERKAAFKKRNSPYKLNASNWYLNKSNYKKIYFWFLKYPNFWDTQVEVKSKFPITIWGSKKVDNNTINVFFKEDKFLLQIVFNVSNSSAGNTHNKCTK